MAPVEELALLDFDRSNKGASKQRRDQINAEIAVMRDLLPLPESSRQRLSQLQIMSLTCVYIRKCNVLQKLFRSNPQDPQLPDTLDFFQALTGFLLVTTREGKLLYISENVTDFLGHSMVDMKTQGDSLYDIVDKRDHGTVQAQLMGPQEDKDLMADVSFFCRMNMSRTLKRQSGFGDVKVMHVRGHFIHVNNSESGCPSDSQCVFMATCSPLITPDLKENLVQNNTMVFKTVHQLDMTFLEVTKTAEYHLGCSTEELSKKSWYSMLHPEDIHEAKEKHVQLIRSNHEMGCMMTVRMLRTDGSSFWVNIVMHVRQAAVAQNDEPVIVCINQVIDAREAYQIKVQGHMFSMYPSRAHEIWGSHLPAVTTQSQEPSGGHWIQQRGSTSVPMASYPGNIPVYLTQVSRPPYFRQCPPAMSSNQVTKAMADSQQFVQSGELKAILKRKIQGSQSATTCKPMKIAKMSWDMDGSNGGVGYPEMDHHGLSSMEPYGHVPLSGSRADCQGPTMQVLQPSNYRIGVMTAKKSHQVLTCQGVPSTVVSKMSSMISEQVVPDVNVPESYLTPDPSPVSSPQPSYVSVKTEVMDPEEQGKSSVSILQALQNLAAHPQAGRMDKAPTAAQPAGVVPVKTAAPRKKELPIFDASDIDSFFETLKPAEAEAMTSVKMEKVEIKQEIKMELPDEPTPNDNIPNFAALKEERSSPAQCMSYGSPNVVPNMVQPSTPAQALPQIHSPHSQSYIPTSPESLSFPYPETSSPDPRASPRKGDMLVATTMACSPQSTTSQESIDDLLSYFSDDGMTISPLDMESRRSVLESTTSEELLDDHYENYPKSLYMDSHCNIPVPLGTRRLPEELSPQSTTSSLAGEDDVMDDHSTFTLDMALSVLDAQDQKDDSCHSSLKDRDVLGMPNEFGLDLLLDSFVPSQGSLDLIKNGQ